MGQDNMSKEPLEGMDHAHLPDPAPTETLHGYALLNPSHLARI